MSLPFSRLEFLQVFAAFNQAIWPLQFGTAVLGAVAMTLLFVDREWTDRTIAAVLVAFWAFVGIGYHWLFFSEINPAAYPFGALFLVAAVIFLVEGVLGNRIRFRFHGGPLHWLAGLLLAYSFVVYPALGLAATHPYPETPLFGVAPCPTTIFTLGLLVLAWHPRPMLLGAAPMLWSAIGGSAAILLNIPQDWGLIVAALIWLGAWVYQRTAFDSRISR